ncbi:hypothetical protein [Scytonema sp. NUACC26]|uniref:hypothetical protein n=1 Tax=Scytonema sp. NUACC26 TaxID=3140176 RepID=UPI0034DCC36C
MYAILQKLSSGLPGEKVHTRKPYYYLVKVIVSAAAFRNGEVQSYEAGYEYLQQPEVN